MSNIRKRLTKAFKTKVAVAALKGDKSLSQLASEHGVHTSQIKDWKEQALEGIEQSFLNKVTKSSERTQALLYEEIGRLKVENEFLKKKTSMLTSAERMLLIDPSCKQFSIRKQCALLNVNRSSHYYVPQHDVNSDIEVMGLIDKLYTAHPFLGYRRITKILRRHGHVINPKRILRLMNVMGIQAIHPGPMTSLPHPEHKIYPYLLKNVLIVKPNQVWAADVAYIRMLRGFVYLVAVLDWFSRFVVSWRIACSLEATFCVEALEEALSVAIPEIFNTDQGSQFTSEAFTTILNKAEVAISMDGRGRCMDNIFTERLWRTVKYEEVYLKDYLSLEQAHRSLKEYFLFYNYERPHQALGYKTPAEMHYREGG